MNRVHPVCFAHEPEPIRRQDHVVLKRYDCGTDEHVFDIGKFEPPGRQRNFLGVRTALSFTVNACVVVCPDISRLRFCSGRTECAIPVIHTCGLGDVMPPVCVEPESTAILFHARTGFGECFLRVLARAATVVYWNCVCLYAVKVYCGGHVIRIGGVGDHSLDVMAHGIDRWRQGRIFDAVFESEPLAVRVASRHCVMIRTECDLSSRVHACKVWISPEFKPNRVGLVRYAVWLVVV